MLEPLFSVGERERYERVLFMNDVIFCAEDALKLVAVEEEVDAISGIDILSQQHNRVYDTWILRTITFLLSILLSNFSLFFCYLKKKRRSNQSTSPFCDRLSYFFKVHTRSSFPSVLQLGRNDQFEGETLLRGNEVQESS